MLINAENFITILITLLFIIIGLTIVVKVNKLEIKNLRVLFWTTIGSIVLLLIIVNTLPDVYIVNNTGYEKKRIIGTASVQVKYGRIKIKGECVVNISSSNIYVESLQYIDPISQSIRKITDNIHSEFQIPKNNNTNEIISIPPYVVYEGRIDYVFETPPETIHIRSKAGTWKPIEHDIKWLHR